MRTTTWATTLSHHVTSAMRAQRRREWKTSKDSRPAMWKCGKCQESVEDAFDSCWNCGTTRDGVVDPTFKRVPQAAAPTAAQISALSCTRCDRPLQYVGTRRFHEG